MEGNVTPIRPARSLDDWKAYIGEASAVEIDAIIEKGRRITEFHDWFKPNGWELNKTWGQACKEVVLVGAATCSQYESVFSASKVFEPLKLFLPPNIELLYYIARAALANEKTFDEAISTGEIHPDITRDEAKAVASRAEAGAREEGEDARIVKLTQQGHDTAAIARKLGWTKSTGGTRTDNQARSLVHKRQKKLGLRPQSKKSMRPRPPAQDPMDRPLLKPGFWESLPQGAEREGLDPVQKVHLFAFSVKQMLDAQTATHGLLSSIINLAGNDKVSPERFVELIDQMLGWQPDKTRPGTGWDTDFAAKAQKTLDSLDRFLGPAADRLNALRELIQARAAKS